MKSIIARVRSRLSFANVTSMLALFIALGGTSYAAITLPGNSVGKWQLRSDSVGKSEARRNSIGRGELISSSVGRSEIARNAVGASEVREGTIDHTELTDGGIQAVDLSDATKSAIAAVNAVTFRAAASESGNATGGNAKTITRTTDPGIYSVDFGADVSKCQVSATVAGAGATAGFATVTPGASTNLLTVSTFDGTGTAANRPFNLLVAC